MIRFFATLLLATSCWTTFVFAFSKSDLEGKIAQLSDNYEILQAEVSQLKAQITDLMQRGSHSSTGSTAVRQLAPSGMPRSCADLKNRGHSLNGVYSIVGAKSVETVHCDFCKPTGDPGFQKWIGFANVKTYPTYFHVRRHALYFNQLNIPIPYDVELLNVGGAYDRTTGKFTAPRKGKYFISASELAEFPPSSSEQFINIFLYKNGDLIERSFHNRISNSGYEHDTFSFQSMFHLVKDDQIWLQIWQTSSTVYLKGAEFNHFNGFLLEEDLSIE